MRVSRHGRELSAPQCVSGSSDVECQSEHTRIDEAVARPRVTSDEWGAGCWVLHKDRTPPSCTHTTMTKHDNQAWQSRTSKSDVGREENGLMSGSKVGPAAGRGGASRSSSTSRRGYGDYRARTVYEAADAAAQPTRGTTACPRLSKRSSESGGEGTRPTEMCPASCDGAQGAPV